MEKVYSGVESAAIAVISAGVTLAVQAADLQTRLVGLALVLVGAALYVYARERGMAEFILRKVKAG